MDEEFKRVQYKLFLKTIKYKQSKDGATMTMNGITLQVAKTLGIVWKRRRHRGLSYDKHHSTTEPLHTLD
jgi:hypothetical protein